MLKFISNYFINKYKQSPEYRNEALKFAFEEQSKPKGFKDLEFVFTDSNGKHYYRYINDVKIPIARLEGIQKTYLKLRRRLDEDELAGLVEAAKKELQAVIAGHKGGKVNVLDIAKVNHILDEMVKRDSVLLHEDLLMEMAAHMNIREDEDPGIFDNTILEQKVEKFKKDSKAGLRDFFYTMGLSEYLPSYVTSEEEWEEFCTVSNKILENRKKLIASLTSEVKLPTLTKAE